MSESGETPGRETRPPPALPTRTRICNRNRARWACRARARRGRSRAWARARRRETGATRRAHRRQERSSPSTLPSGTGRRRTPGAVRFPRRRGRRARRAAARPRRRATPPRGRARGRRDTRRERQRHPQRDASKGLVVEEGVRVPEEEVDSRDGKQGDDEARRSVVRRQLARPDDMSHRRVRGGPRTDRRAEPSSGGGEDRERSRAAPRDRHGERSRSTRPPQSVAAYAAATIADTVAVTLSAASRQAVLTGRSNRRGWSSQSRSAKSSASP